MERYVPGRLLVQFRAGTPPERTQAALASVQGRTERQIPGIGVHIVTLPSAGAEKALAQVLRARPEVQAAEPDEILPLEAVTPNDPYFSSQWHLTRIAAPDAWSVTTGSSSVIIAILDTGVDSTHQDLAPKIVAGWNMYNNNSDTADVYGHGTMVAGTAAAAGNNGIGVASVAWNCWIMPIRVSDASGYASYSTIANGLVWAADHGARVANISYMVTTSSSISSGARYFQGKGGLVSVSAGNYSTYDASADNPYILTVSATDANDQIYSWSNTGNNIDVAAPGCVYATSRGGGYSSGCGTSFSAPVVAGVAALLLSVRPGISAAEATQVIRQSADDIGPAGWDPTFGWGRVNAARTVAGSTPTPDTQPPSVAVQSPSSGSVVSGLVAVQMLASDNVGVASVIAAVDGATLCTVTASPYTCSWDTKKNPNGSHSLSVTARDAAGNLSAASELVNVNNLSDTTPPSVAITSPAAGTKVGKNVTVTVNATDNVGVARVDLYVDTKLTASSAIAPFTMKWNTAKAAAGQHTLQTKVYDAAGNAGASPQVIVYR